ncbi:MAG: hypothetical protein WAL71_09710 [Terriglobales bacterium]|jgi:hypothetical protein
MGKLRAVGIGLLIFGIGVWAVAQDNSPQGPAPAPAFGQSAPVLNPDNPPISGIDEPGLKLKVASRSFISPAIQVGETADTDENNRLGTYQVEPVSHVLGALDLQKFWPKSDLILEYLGGGSFETSPKYEVKQLQALGFEGVTRWRTGYLEVRDSFSYIPDGSFDAETGEGLPGLGIALGGLGSGEAGGGLPGTHVFGTGAFEAVGNIPRLANTAIADVVQAISPRSAVTLVGAYSDAHFMQDCQDANPQNCCNSPGVLPSEVTCLINSDQTTIEGGFSHMLSRHDQMAGVAAFQLFRFPYNTGGEIYNGIFNLRWSHTISGRMRFIGGAGPQYTDVRYNPGTRSWSLSGRAILTYQFEHSSMAASWEKYTSQGNGIFAGADTQQARLAYRRPLGRTFTLSADLGYARNQRLGAAILNVNTDNEGTAAIILRKHLGRTYDLLGAYTFNEVAFDESGEAICTSGISNSTGCGTLEQRQRITVGFEWHPKATRIE